MNAEPRTLKERVYNFFEHPASPVAWLFRVLIIALILYSAGAVIAEFLYSDFAELHKDFLYKAEVFVVTVFSIEYLLRFWAAPSRGKFVIDFYNIIDLVAIIPIFLTGLNLGVVRVARLARLARTMRLLRTAKIMRQLWQTSSLNTSKLVQENVVKNLLVIGGIILLSEQLAVFLSSIDPTMLGDVMFATSILALAAMFGFFALSYGDFDPKKVSQRILIHVTSGFLLLPIGIMFLIIQNILVIQLGTFPAIMVGSIWFVYAAVVLWDFANVLKLDASLTEPI